jgi:hypothetical protein
VFEGITGSTVSLITCKASSVGNKLNVLNVQLLDRSEVVALVHDVVTMHTHALGTIHVSPLRVAHTATGLLSIPVLVGITE